MHKIGLLYPCLPKVTDRLGPLVPKSITWPSSLGITAKLRAMRLDELDYHLPSSQIAQRPLDRRDASRLLSLRCDTGEIGDYVFAQLPTLLRGDELLVLNNN